MLEKARSQIRDFLKAVGEFNTKNNRAAFAKEQLQGQAEYQVFFNEIAVQEGHFKELEKEALRTLQHLSGAVTFPKDALKKFGQTLEKERTLLRNYTQKLDQCIAKGTELLQQLSVSQDESQGSSSLRVSRRHVDSLSAPRQKALLKKMLAQRDKKQQKATAAAQAS